jgi:AAA domain
VTASNTATCIPAFCIFDPTAEPSPAQVIFKGLLAKDELAVWIGHEKCFKTTVLLNLSICAAIGRDFLGFQFVAPQPLRVVMFDYESQDNSIHRRYDATCDAMKLSDELRDRLRDNLKIIELRKMVQQGQVIPRIDDSQQGEEFWRRAAATYPADLYSIDPMRCLHGGDENNSTLEKTLADIRSVFKSTIVIPHHMTKRSRNPKDNVRLSADMRLWSDGCRGSGAIKAHADVIVCQEHMKEDDTDVVYLGAFMKDAGDVDPMALEESAPESFLWVPQEKLPDELRRAYDVLRQSETTVWPTQAEAARRVILANNVSRATANRHVKNLIQRRLLTESGAGIGVAV